MDAPVQPVPPRLTFRRRQRLTHAREYQRAFKEGLKKVRGPLVVFAAENGLDHARIGLSVSGRVGNAVERNRIKRLLREAFRLGQREMPPGLDLVVTVRPHRALPLAAYSDLLRNASASLEREWQRRWRRDAAAGEGQQGAP